LEAWMVSIRRQLHKYPETSYDEFKSAAFIKEKLSELGIESTGGQGGTGVTANLGNGAVGAACVALRADMDALPIREQTGLAYSSVHEGIMHACGHDGHVAMLLGAAALLKKSFSGPGRIKLIFQPAEEHGNGAAQLVREGVLDGVQAVFGGHIDTHFKTGEITVDEGLICGYADPFQITIKGRGGHAARPHEGSDAVVAASSLVMIIQTLVSREVDPNKSQVITIGSFQAGTVHNVIAGEAVLKGTVRSTDEVYREKTICGLKRIVQSIETMYDVHAGIVFEQGLPAVVNSARATGIARSAAWDTTSVDKVISQGYPSLGGEDFSFYQHYVEGCLVRFGAMLPGPVGPAHSPTFDFDEKCLKYGAAWLAAAGWRWLNTNGRSVVSESRI
ncbi:MAG: M20 metallopeptidase family protein, partial [Desulfocapsaceae bacterium]